MRSVPDVKITNFSTGCEKCYEQTCNSTQKQIATKCPERRYMYHIYNAKKLHSQIYLHHVVTN